MFSAKHILIFLITVWGTGIHSYAQPAKPVKKFLRPVSSYMQKKYNKPVFCIEVQGDKKDDFRYYDFFADTGLVVISAFTTDTLSYLFSHIVVFEYATAGFATRAYDEFRRINTPAIKRGESYYSLRKNKISGAAKAGGVVYLKGNCIFFKENDCETEKQKVMGDDIDFLRAIGGNTDKGTMMYAVCNSERFEEVPLKKLLK